MYLNGARPHPLPSLMAHYYFNRWFFFVLFSLWVVPKKIYSKTELSFELFPSPSLRTWKKFVLVFIFFQFRFFYGEPKRLVKWSVITSSTKWKWIFFSSFSCFVVDMNERKNEMWLTLFVTSFASYHKVWPVIPTSITTKTWISTSINNDTKNIDFNLNSLEFDK